MTPLEKLHQLLPFCGFALVTVPGAGEVCRCDKFNKVITLGVELDDVTLGIVGLHELGHALVTNYYSDFRYIQEVAYSLELQAWAWAEKRVPPGYEKEFVMLKEHGLNTYR